MAHQRYDDSARARLAPEPAKRPGRTAFERDRARVLHSAALRRLAAKTQVVVPWESDFPRTRLTHSLECAQVGRELGKALGCDPDLVDAACLAHDLGHPPFGHNGEKALDEVARRYGGFEGNAQSFRILTRLEAKAFSGGGTSAGLNLTRATLDATVKYPWPRPVEGGKFGVYAGDRDAFRWVREGAPEGRRCLEAQVMDWADDVAYSVHDLEDALHSGHVTPERLVDPGGRRELLEVAARYAAEHTGEHTGEPGAGGRGPCVGVAEDELGAALQRLLDLPYWPRSFDGSLGALAALKNTTSQLIGRFCEAAEGATREAFGGGPLRRYAADLVVPRATRLECAVLKGITGCYVMTREGVADLRARQRELVSDIAAALLLGAPHALEPVFREEFARAETDTARMRAVIDQIASLTDTSAVVLHRHLMSGAPAVAAQGDGPQA
ncbi:MAG: deoxyguanosinetriphosphate triphosphohydrolase [Carbonactinosporaceae bacterium]